MLVREIDPYSESEIQLVARRMRETMVEVLGESRGNAIYSMDWLLDRVRWHLNPKCTLGKVFVLEDLNGEIQGHAIARIDFGSDFGYFSTLFVDPPARGRGLAKSLIAHVESWLVSQGMLKIIYNTAINHKTVISLFRSRGYLITHSESEMVQLTKNF